MYCNLVYTMGPDCEVEHTLPNSNDVLVFPHTGYNMAEISEKGGEATAKKAKESEEKAKK